jgi:Holliday junction resolvase
VSNSERRKGATGELEVAKLFQAAGFDCDRTPNSGALRITGDLYGSVPAHLEVKRQEVARPWQWFEQAQAEAPAGVMPVVAFRRSRSPWLAIVPLEALVALMAAAALAGEPTDEERREIGDPIANGAGELELAARREELEP